METVRERMIRIARADPTIAKLLKNKVVLRVIAVPGKIVNFITKEKK